MSLPGGDADKDDPQAIGLLLVDDEPEVLQSLRRSLRTEPYQLYTASNGTQALAHLEQARVDIVVSDIRMPGMSGTELLAQIAARWPEISRIALTGGSAFADAVEAINNGGIFRWLHKPWDAGELRRTVGEAAERTRKIQAIRRRFQAAGKAGPGQEPPPHVIRRFFKGELIFREGTPGQQLHFIREGRVELSMERDGRRIILDTRRAGDCFGATAVILGQPRVVTATAADYTETFSLTQPALDDLLTKSDPLLASMLRSLGKQSRQAFANLAMRNPVVNAIESAAWALDLMARAATQKPGGHPGKGSAPLVKLPHQEVVQTLSAVMGMLKSSVQDLLEQMASLNLLLLDPSRQVCVRPGEIIAMARNLGAHHGDVLGEGLRAETELMSLDQIADLLSVDKSLIQNKMTEGELPETLWAFRKSETLRLIHEKGREFLRQRKVKVKKVEEFDAISDILFLDRDTLGRVLGKVDPYRLANLLRDQTPAVRERALGALPSRVRADLASAIEAEAGAVDKVEMGLLEAEIIERIKSLKGIPIP